MQGEKEEKKEKERLWGGDGEEEEGLESPCSPAVAELVRSLKRERLNREVTLALRTGLRDARANFSFLRLRGLRTILSFLRSVADSDSAIRLFRHTQSLPDLQGNSLFFFGSRGFHELGFVSLPIILFGFFRISMNFPFRISVDRFCPKTNMAC